MILENLLPHKRNTQILVNGKIYKIDDKGLVTVERQEDIDKLMQSESWREYDPNAREKEAQARVAALKAQGGIQLKAADGSIVPRDDATKPVVDADKKAKEADDTAAMEEAVTAAEEAKQKEDPPIPDEGEEWPDPEEYMSMPYLMMMADAYEVSYAKNIGQKTLIARIKDAMYE